jgi:riboflavin kinase/FMN adenylyltransferase
MIIHKGYKNLRLNAPVVTMGIFDGVHLGHRSLLDYLVIRSWQVGGESAVITFHPHPRLVLEKNRKGFTFLSTMEEKIAMLEKAGIGHLIIIDFTLAFSKIEACDFVQKILVREIGTKHLIIGYDHHFGHHGDGNFNTIKNCAVSMGFKVEQVRGLHSESGAISSTAIREALLKGSVEEAARWLGYNYTFRGKVVEGRKIGRKLGFPTANIRPDDRHKLVPADGVYAVEVKMDGKSMKGMLSIGTNPTINKTAVRRSIEVNIFDFGEEIYGRNMDIIFRFRLRDEIKFAGIQQLSQQMADDKEKALRLLL